MASVIAIITIIGTRPVLWHHFGPEQIPLERQTRSGVAGNDPEEWHKTVLATETGQLYFEGSYIFGALSEGARYTRRGRGTLQQTLCSTLQVLDERVLTDRSLPKRGKIPQNATAAPVYLDVRTVKNPATKGRNVRYRIAAGPGWKTTFRILWDDTLIAHDQMRAIAIDSGKFVGLGDGRKIGLGRFTVEKFELEVGRASKKASKGKMAKHAA